MPTGEISVLPYLSEITEEELVRLEPRASQERPFLRAHWKESLSGCNVGPITALENFLGSVEIQLAEHGPKIVKQVRQDIHAKTFNSFTTEPFTVAGIRKARNHLSRRLINEQDYQSEKKAFERLLREMIEDENRRAEKSGRKIKALCRNSQVSTESIVWACALGCRHEGVNMVVWLSIVDLSIIYDGMPNPVSFQSVVMLVDKSQHAAPEGGLLDAFEEVSCSEGTDLGESTEEEPSISQIGKSSMHSRVTMSKKADLMELRAVVSTRRHVSEEMPSTIITSPSQRASTRGPQRGDLQPNEYDSIISKNDESPIPSTRDSNKFSRATGIYSDGAKPRPRPQTHSFWNKRRMHQVPSALESKSGQSAHSSDRSVFPTGQWEQAHAKYIKDYVRPAGHINAATSFCKQEEDIVSFSARHRFPRGVTSEFLPSTAQSIGAESAERPAQSLSFDPSRYESSLGFPPAPEQSFETLDAGAMPPPCW